jgi:hypothetical protein
VGKMKVTNLKSTSGNPVANQFELYNQKHNYFQSYNSTIVHIDYTYAPCRVELDEKYWNYSKTTSKYRNQFLGETTKETQAKIDSGKYLLTDLNQ